MGSKKNQKLALKHGWFFFFTSFTIYKVRDTFFKKNQNQFLKLDLTYLYIYFFGKLKFQFLSIKNNWMYNKNVSDKY